MKKVITFVAIALILLCGGTIVYGLFDIYSTKHTLKESGKRTIATVERSWRGRCGSGYGNFAYYSFEVNNITYKDTSSCSALYVISPNEQFYLLYMEEDPNINRILFDEPVK